VLRDSGAVGTCEKCWSAVSALAEDVITGNGVEYRHT